jgi:hypothetical protein
VLLLRCGRVALIAFVFWFLFKVSQQATAMRSDGEQVPGLLGAVAILGVLFLVRAGIAEFMGESRETVLRRDFLWGLGAGALAIVVHRLVA